MSRTPAPSYNAYSEDFTAHVTKHYFKNILNLQN